ncbi:hypothetical protein ACWGAN_07290 [Streptomyces sp. NPDC054945]
MTDETTPAPRHLATITGIDTQAHTRLTADGQDLSDLAPAAAAALALLADAIKRGHADQEDIVQALKNARVDEAFASVLVAASDAVMNGLEDPYEFDGRLHGENLSAAASQVRDAFRWL